MDKGIVLSRFAVFLCCFVKAVFLHGRQDAEVSLQAFEVVVTNVIFDHYNQALFSSKPITVIAFAFEDSPESFHRSVVNALADSGHALLHTGIYQLLMKSAVGILVPSVTVE